MTNNCVAYKASRLFILNRVVLRNAILRYCKSESMMVPKIGESWAELFPNKVRTVTNSFGKYGELWDGESNEFISPSEIKLWKQFLLVPDADYNTFFHLSSSERKNLWSNLQREQVSERYLKQVFINQANHVNYFKGDPQGKRLLLLKRLSRIYVDDMFMNLAGTSMIKLTGSDVQLSFYQKMGPDGLQFNGQPNSYLCQQEIDYERQELGITQDEFKRFYTLNFDERCLLFQSSWLY